MKFPHRRYSLRVNPHRIMDVASAVDVKPICRGHCALVHPWKLCSSTSWSSARWTRSRSVKRSLRRVCKKSCIFLSISPIIVLHYWRQRSMRTVSRVTPKHIAVLTLVAKNCIQAFLWVNSSPERPFMPFGWRSICCGESRFCPWWRNYMKTWSSSGTHFFEVAHGYVWGHRCNSTFTHCHIYVIMQKSKSYSCGTLTVSMMLSVIFLISQNDIVGVFTCVWYRNCPNLECRTLCRSCAMRRTLLLTTSLLVRWYTQMEQNHQACSWFEQWSFLVKKYIYYFMNTQN